MKFNRKSINSAVERILKSDPELAKEIREKAAQFEEGPIGFETFDMLKSYVSEC